MAFGRGGSGGGGSGHGTDGRTSNIQPLVWLCAVIGIGIVFPAGRIMPGQTRSVGCTIKQKNKEFRRIKLNAESCVGLRQAGLRHKS